MAAASAIIGAVGTIGSMAQGMMPYKTSSMSTLTPAQEMMQAQTILSLLPQQAGHFKTLGELGQKSPNAYGTLPDFASDYNSKLLIPRKTNMRNNMAALQDRVHGRSNDILMNRYRTESRLSSNSLRQSLMQQDSNLKQMATESAAQRQLQALSGMAGQFGSVMGQNTENWARNNPTGLDYASTGLAGIRSLGSAANTIADQFGMSGIGSGMAGYSSGGMDGYASGSAGSAGGGF